MSYQNLQCDNITRYRILSKPGGLTYKDICLITGCGKTSAQKIINAIHVKIASTPNSKIPTQGRVTRESFCKYVGWDFNEVQVFAFAELSAINKANYDGNVAFA